MSYLGNQLLIRMLNDADLVKKAGIGWSRVPLSMLLWINDFNAGHCVIVVFI